MLSELQLWTLIRSGKLSSRINRRTALVEVCEDELNKFISQNPKVIQKWRSTNP